MPLQNIHQKKQFIFYFFAKAAVNSAGIIVFFVKFSHVDRRTLLLFFPLFLQSLYTYIIVQMRRLCARTSYIYNRIDP